MIQTTRVHQKTSRDERAQRQNQAAQRIVDQKPASNIEAQSTLEPPASRELGWQPSVVQEPVQLQNTTKALRDQQGSAPAAMVASLFKAATPQSMQMIKEKMLGFDALGCYQEDQHPWTSQTPWAFKTKTNKDPDLPSI